jgi:hypothetical protein
MANLQISNVPRQVLSLTAKAYILPLSPMSLHILEIHEVRDSKRARHSQLTARASRLCPALTLGQAARALVQRHGFGLKKHNGAAGMQQ